MELFGREIQREMRGVDVWLLHFELGLLIDFGGLGSRIPNDELERNYFGPGTEQAVLDFQNQYGLEPTGLVNSETAEAINYAIYENGEITSEVILTRLNQAIRLVRETVSDVDLSQQIQQLEGIITVLEQENNRLRYSVGTSTDHAENLQKALEVAHSLIDQLQGQPDKQTDNFVQGRVIGADLRGLEGMRIRIVDKNIGEDVILRETVSGEQGGFEIHYTATDRSKEKLDLQVQVLNSTGEVLGTSAVRYNATSLERNFEVVLTAETSPRVPEFQRLLGELRPHVGSLDNENLLQRLGTLREDQEQQDISYLANKTGWDARMVAMTSLASQYSQREEVPEDSRVDPAFYYALFRAGLPANDTILGQISPNVVEHIWKRAVEQDILPGEMGKAIPENLERFTNQAGKRLLSAAPGIGVANFKEIISLSIDEDDTVRQEAFAQLYYEHRSNLNEFWERASSSFESEIVNRMQLDGKLNYLTINNVPLIRKLHTHNVALQDPVELVRDGFYRADAWLELLDDVAIPNEIPGKDDPDRRQNYADLMAHQLRLSYPTAVVSHMVRKNTIPLNVDDEQVVRGVTQFLDFHQGHFELGIHPVEQYVRKNQIDLDAPVLEQMKRLQRVYQISASDEIMGSLMAHNLNSAHDVVQYDEQTFIRTFKNDLGGEANAHLTYAKAHQVNHAVWNIVTGYILERTAYPLYVLGNGSAPPDDDNGATPDESGVLAYPTLEGLFGEMDYCDCEHCRSWLSPAAYLVDLLLFLDAPKAGKNPLEVLEGRRPDIQHLQLSCENTNVVLPYVDLVNEILEHFVVNKSIDAFTGFNVEEGITSEELLANPQFVNDAAYVELRSKFFPTLLPFHQPLEALRRCFDKFDTPLYMAMQFLRKNDGIDRPGTPLEPGYGWRDILMERLGVSRPEYRALTDASLTIHELYGADPALTQDALIDSLSSAKHFADRLHLSYEQVIDLTMTRFINPNSHLIPKLERLQVALPKIVSFLSGDLDEAEFVTELPDDLDSAAYGGDVVEWLQNSEDTILGLIVLVDTNSNDLCSFNQVAFRYASGDKLRAIEFTKLIRFIRLWRKLGWSIEQTDKAVTALYPDDQYPQSGDDFAAASARFETGFMTLLLRLAQLQVVIEQLGLKPKRDLIILLACWNMIDNHGFQSLYRKMFLNPTIVELDDVFKDDGYGNYLADKREFQQSGVNPPRLLQHIEALLAAFNLTRDDFDLITYELGFDDTTVLALPEISAVFRYSYLARALRHSVREVLTLKHLSGLDPFAPLDISQPPDAADPFGSVRPPTVRFIELAKIIKESPLKVSQLLYFLQHLDLSGRASPPEVDIRGFATSLRDSLVRINQDNSIEDDPTGEIARSKMALVYGSEATGIFFGLLNNTSVFTASYSHLQETLDAAVTDVSTRLAYDHFQKALSFQGVMTDSEKQAYDNLNGMNAAFINAIQTLFDTSRQAFASFFERYPALYSLYQGFTDSTDPLSERMSDLLEDFLPDLRAKLKQQQVRQIISAETKTALDLVTTLLDTPELLESVRHPGHSAIHDFVGLELRGLSADIYFADDIVGTPNQKDVITPTLNYGIGSDKATLPLNPAGPGSAISGVWRAYVQAPDDGFYNFYIQADSGSEIVLKWNGEEEALNGNNGVWQFQNPVDLIAGQLYSLEITAKKLTTTLSLHWATKTQGRILLPASQLYPATVMSHYRTMYLRLLKAISIADELEFSSDEYRYFAANPAYQIGGHGWLNALPVTQRDADATTHALLRIVTMLVQYQDVKSAMRVRDESLVTVLANPSALGEDDLPLLHRVTGWQQSDLDAILTHFGKTLDELNHFENLKRVYDAFQVVKGLGIGAKTLIPNTSNEATADMLRALQAALRTRYDQSAWLQVIQPINDGLRSVERDALVTYVLHLLSQNVATHHIDTADKLFEFFLIDVQMDPCMKTSRIKQAISSVQLFVQRCLLNLEPEIDSSTIKVDYWKWMKRYRVWEANRKVFLYPENWLEPELRDNKSPFFREFESELLQSDITDDAAATALVHYLEKLDQVAKLEICGMYFEENEDNNLADDVVHVIGRTSGAQRTYYYRKQQGSISWSPWEKIDLKIEDNPVLPVVWKGRLFIFWVSILQEPPAEHGGGSDEKMSLNSVSPKQLRSVSGAPTLDVSATLYWSEYYHGKWQIPRTSDMNKPAILGKFRPGEFDRAKLSLSSTDQQSTGLLINVSYPGRYTHFRLFSTHSVPVRAADDPTGWTFVYPLWKIQSREFTEITSPFRISYYSGMYIIPIDGNADQDTKEVLKGGFLYDIVRPRHTVNGLFHSPFFYQDRQHTFYVNTVISQVSVGGFFDVGVFIPPLEVIVPEIPLAIIPDLPFPPIPEEVIPLELIIPVPGVVDPAPWLSMAARNPNLVYGLDRVGVVQFGDNQIGPGGLINFEVRFNR